jgi:hypothetical protein
MDEATKTVPAPPTWQQGEPDMLPWGSAHRFLVWDPDFEVHLLVLREAWTSDPVAAGLSYTYVIIGTDGPADAMDINDGEWLERWHWIFVPPVTA